VHCATDAASVKHGRTNYLREASWSLFVDGENFAKRGAAALKAAEIDMTGGPWRPDVYLWLPQTDARYGWFAEHPMVFMGDGPGWSVPSANRAYYYTSTISGDPEWTDTRLELREIGFEPRLYRRVKGQSKAVDIALATDALMLAAERQTEVSVILSGDGDFVPVVEAMKRLGQRVVVGGFAGSTSADLLIAADDFVDLTPLLLESWEEFATSREAVAARARGE
jgi:hypothetical protein